MAVRLGRVAGAYGDVLRSRSYFPLWLGQLISNFGDTLHHIALVVLVFQLTGQGLAVAALVAALDLPVTGRANVEAKSRQAAPQGRWQHDGLPNPSPG